MAGLGACWRSPSDQVVTQGAAGDWSPSRRRAWSARCTCDGTILTKTTVTTPLTFASEPQWLSLSDPLRHSQYSAVFPDCAAVNN